MAELETRSEKAASIKTHGGRRPGAGQPPKASKYKRQIAKATDIMGRMLPEAADATVDLATGAWVMLVYNSRTKKWVKPTTDAMMEAAVDTGYFRVYRELPDIRAIQTMFERLMGKVPQTVDVRIQQAVSDVMEAQALLMRVVEEHVPEEYLAPIRHELQRVAQLHHSAQSAVDIE